MRKRFYLWTTVIILVITLIFAFANILIQQQYYFFFYPFSASTTVVLLISSVFGFLIGFFAMMYSFEVRREKDIAHENDTLGVSPAASEPSPDQLQDGIEGKKSDTLTPPEEESKEESPDHQTDAFDEDDEVLG